MGIENNRMTLLNSKAANNQQVVVKTRNILKLIFKIDNIPNGVLSLDNVYVNGLHYLYVFRLSNLERENRLLVHLWSYLPERKQNQRNVPGKSKSHISFQLSNENLNLFLDQQQPASILGRDSVLINTYLNCNELFNCVNYVDNVILEPGETNRPIIIAFMPPDSSDFPFHEDSDWGLNFSDVNGVLRVTGVVLPKSDSPIKTRNSALDLKMIIKELADRNNLQREDYLTASARQNNQRQVFKVLGEANYVAFGQTIGFRAKVCKSHLKLDFSDEELIFDDCIYGGVYSKDFTILNQSEIDLYWRINEIECVIANALTTAPNSKSDSNKNNALEQPLLLNRTPEVGNSQFFPPLNDRTNGTMTLQSWFQFTEYDSGELINPNKPIGPHSSLRIRVTFKPPLPAQTPTQISPPTSPLTHTPSDPLSERGSNLFGDFSITYQLENLNDPNNILYLPIPVTLRPTDHKELVMTSTNSLDFGDCYIGQWVSQKLVIKNVSELSVEVNFSKANNPISKMNPNNNNNSNNEDSTDQYHPNHGDQHEIAFEVEVEDPNYHLLSPLKKQLLAQGKISALQDQTSTSRLSKLNNHSAAGVSSSSGSSNLSLDHLGSTSQKSSSILDLTNNNNNNNSNNNNESDQKLKGLVDQRQSKQQGEKLIDAESAGRFSPSGSGATISSGSLSRSSSYEKLFDEEGVKGGGGIEMPRVGTVYSPVYDHLEDEETKHSSEERQQQQIFDEEMRPDSSVSTKNNDALMERMRIDECVIEPGEEKSIYVLYRALSTTSSNPSFLLFRKSCRIQILYRPILPQNEKNTILNTNESMGNVSQQAMPDEEVEFLFSAPKLFNDEDDDPTLNFLSSMELNDKQSKSLKWERKVIHGRARVCNSVIRISPSNALLDFGQVNVGQVASEQVTLTNSSDLAATLSIQLTSKILSLNIIDSDSDSSNNATSSSSTNPINSESNAISPTNVLVYPLSSGSRFKLAPKKSVTLRLDICPRKVNPNYAKQIIIINESVDCSNTFSNIKTFNKNNMVIEVRSRNVDLKRVTLHSQLYSLITPLSASTFLDFGTVILNSLSIRTIFIDPCNKSQEAPLCLEMKATRYPEVQIYLADPESGCFGKILERIHHNLNVRASGSSPILEEGQQMFNWLDLAFCNPGKKSIIISKRNFAKDLLSNHQSNGEKKASGGNGGGAHIKRRITFVGGGGGNSSEGVKLNEHSAPSRPRSAANYISSQGVGSSPRTTPQLVKHHHSNEVSSSSATKTLPQLATLKQISERLDSLIVMPESTRQQFETLFPLSSFEAFAFGEIFKESCILVSKKGTSSSLVLQHYLNNLALALECVTSGSSVNQQLLSISFSSGSGSVKNYSARMSMEERFVKIFILLKREFDECTATNNEAILTPFHSLPDNTLDCSTSKRDGSFLLVLAYRPRLATTKKRSLTTGNQPHQLLSIGSSTTVNSMSKGLRKDSSASSTPTTTTYNTSKLLIKPLLKMAAAEDESFPSREILLRSNITSSIMDINQRNINLGTITLYPKAQRFYQQSSGLYSEESREDSFNFVNLNGSSLAVSATGSTVPGSAPVSSSTSTSTTTAAKGGKTESNQIRLKSFLIRNLSDCPLFYRIKKSGSISSEYLHIVPPEAIMGVIRPYGKREIDFILEPRGIQGQFVERLLVQNLHNPDNDQLVVLKALIKKAPTFYIGSLMTLDFGALETSTNGIFTDTKNAPQEMKISNLITPVKVKSTRPNTSTYLSLLEMKFESPQNSNLAYRVTVKSYGPSNPTFTNSAIRESVEDLLEGLEQKAKIAKRKGQFDKVEKIQKKISNLTKSNTSEIGSGEFSNNNNANNNTNSNNNEEDLLVDEPFKREELSDAGESMQRLMDNSLFNGTPSFLISIEPGKCICLAIEIINLAAVDAVEGGGEVEVGGTILVNEYRNLDVVKKISWKGSLLTAAATGVEHSPSSITVNDQSTISFSRFLSKSSRVLKLYPLSYPMSNLKTPARCWNFSASTCDNANIKGGDLGKLYPIICDGFMLSTFYLDLDLHEDEDEFDLSFLDYDSTSFFDLNTRERANFKDEDKNNNSFSLSPTLSLISTNANLVVDISKSKRSSTSASEDDSDNICSATEARFSFKAKSKTVRFLVKHLVDVKKYPDCCVSDHALTFTCHHVNEKKVLNLKYVAVRRAKDAPFITGTFGSSLLFPLIDLGNLYFYPHSTEEANDRVCCYSLEQGALLPTNGYAEIVSCEDDLVIKIESNLKRQILLQGENQKGDSPSISLGPLKKGECARFKVLVRPAIFYNNNGGEGGDDEPCYFDRDLIGGLAFKVYFSKGTGISNGFLLMEQSVRVMARVGISQLTLQLTEGDGEERNVLSLSPNEPLSVIDSYSEKAWSFKLFNRNSLLPAFFSINSDQLPFLELEPRQRDTLAPASSMNISARIRKDLFDSGKNGIIEAIISIRNERNPSQRALMPVYFRAFLSPLGHRKATVVNATVLVKAVQRTSSSGGGDVGSISRWKAFKGPIIRFLELNSNSCYKVRVDKLQVDPASISPKIILQDNESQDRPSGNNEATVSCSPLPLKDDDRYPIVYELNAPNAKSGYLCLDTLIDPSALTGQVFENRSVFDLLVQVETTENGARFIEHISVSIAYVHPIVHVVGNGYSEEIENEIMIDESKEGLSPFIQQNINVYLNFEQLIGKSESSLIKALIAGRSGERSMKNVLKELPVTVSIPIFLKKEAFSNEPGVTLRVTGVSKELIVALDYERVTLKSECESQSICDFAVLDLWALFKKVYQGSSIDNNNNDDAQELADEDEAKEEIQRRQVQDDNNSNTEFIYPLFMLENELFQEHDIQSSIESSSLETSLDFNNPISFWVKGSKSSSFEDNLKISIESTNGSALDNGAALDNGSALEDEDSTSSCAIICLQWSNCDSIPLYLSLKQKNDSCYYHFADCGDCVNLILKDDGESRIRVVVMKRDHDDDVSSGVVGDAKDLELLIRASQEGIPIASITLLPSNKE